MQVVGAIITNQTGEFLLQLRDEHVRMYKNCWTLFGGHVEPGETPDEALLRELYEELRLTPEAIDSIELIQRNAHADAPEQLIYEITTDVSIDQLVLGEGAAMEYVPASKLFDRAFGFNIREVLERYLATQKGTKPPAASDHT